MYIQGSSRTYPTYEDYKNSGKFTNDQLKWIRKGFDVNLSPRDVYLYAQPEYTPNQMEELFDGFNCELELRDVMIYADPAFDEYQMNEIKMALWDFELDRDLVMQFADPTYSADQMNTIRNIIYSHEDEYSASMNEILDLICHPEYSIKKITTLLHLWLTHRSHEIIDYVKSLDLPNYAYYWIRRGFDSDLTLEQVQSYAIPDVSNEWMRDQYYFGCRNR